MIVVSVNYVHFDDYFKRKRQEVALEVLCENAPDDCQLLAFTFSDEDCSGIPREIKKVKSLKRDSFATIGNSRRLPYIHEILDKTSEFSVDVFGFINSDILLTSEFFNILKRRCDAYAFYRTDIAEVTTRQFVKGDFRPIYGGDTHEGCDAFFFTKNFWYKNRLKFNQDFVLGETEWDTYYRYRIASLTDNYYLGRDLYHVYHDPKWNTKSKGAQNNIKIWEDFYEETGRKIKVKEPV